MSDRVSPGPVSGACDINEAVCIHTKKIYSSCRDKDCIEELRVYLTRSSQTALDSAVSVKGESAEMLCVLVDVEPVPFNKGYYTVDVTYYYRVFADVYGSSGRPCRITGIASFNKTIILYGSEGSVKIFSSQYTGGRTDGNQAARSNLPTAVVETVDPVCLSVKVLDNCDCSRCDKTMVDIPDCVLCCFDEDIVIGNECKRMYVTLGQFSIIRLERDSQLLIPVYGYCVPQKDCSGPGGSTGTSPCELFSTISFPMDDFFPPGESGESTPAAVTCPCKK